ncbi:hypothetical protein C1A50_2862 [Paenibacillus polymyxa]|nr:hypothetical protein C1A50_2862 [Paenibacillus polymyxa]
MDVQVVCGLLQRQFWCSISFWLSSLNRAGFNIAKKII